jgi:3-deoxy-7-phosphoheptulonate synthase
VGYPSQSVRVVVILQLRHIFILGLTGFKNGTDGSVSIAVDAMRASSNPHAFMGVTDQGLAAIVKTSGNKDVHIILRGANKGPNYSKEFVLPAAAACLKARPERLPAIMIDCSRMSAPFLLTLY